MTLKIILLVCAATVVPLQAQAQVIEINDSGEARTFDRPTIFAGTQASSIAETPKAPTRTVSILLAEAARSHGVDQRLLEAVAWQESRGRMNAVSTKGARGVMQLMPGTAAELGVRADDLADNIRGGALYLRRQIDRFNGSIPLALAAYNAGPGAVMRYRGVPPYRETQNYVAQIIRRWQPSPKTALTTPPPPPPSVLEVP